jgi:hypothetical protein
MVEAVGSVREAATHPHQPPLHIEGALFMTAGMLSMCRGLPFPVTGHTKPGWTSGKHSMHCCHHRLSRVRCGKHPGPRGHTMLRLDPSCIVFGTSMATRPKGSPRGILGRSPVSKYEHRLERKCDICWQALQLCYAACSRCVCMTNFVCLEYWPGPITANNAATCHYTQQHAAYDMRCTETYCDNVT